MSRQRLSIYLSTSRNKYITNKPKLLIFLRGFARLKKFWKFEITLEVGGRVQVLLGKKEIENRTKIKFCIYTFRASIPAHVAPPNRCYKSNYDLSVRPCH